VLIQLNSSSSIQIKYLDYDLFHGKLTEGKAQLSWPPGANLLLCDVNCTESRLLFSIPGLVQVMMVKDRCQTHGMLSTTVLIKKACFEL